MIDSGRVSVLSASGFHAAAPLLHVALACEVALALARAHWRGTGARAVCAPIAAAC